MATVERVIPPAIADDGSVHYSSVMSPSDDSIAVCHMVPDRIIPVIFVPGVMGTNLMDDNEEPVWLVNGSASVLTKWANGSPDKRKRVLDPKKTRVFANGTIPQGTRQNDAELKRRGWGEVGFMSYGTFLPWLENALNDADQCKTGERARLMKTLVANAPGVELLTHDEVALSYKYQLPLHAVGYNWLQSNAESAKRLDGKIQEFMAYYRSKGYMCDYVIIVTHSMGGLVSRYYSELMGGNKSVLGIVHGVMPATGSATAYKRVKAGTEMPAGIALGANAAEMTAVFAQSPGPLQLLPSPEYGMGWLKLKDGKNTVGLPKADPYKEIYTVRGKWWGLCDDKLINPLDPKKVTIDRDWIGFVDLIRDEVEKFQTKISRKYHATTYAFYGDDPSHKTWGDVVWERRISSALRLFDAYPKVDDLTAGQVLHDPGRGEQTVNQHSGGRPLATSFILKGAGENGDGTVPIRSGAAPGRRVKACVSYPGVDHEGAYKNRPQQLFALWAITKIACGVAKTSMAYKS
ncbi:triacylglycerol lipase [Cupriavidus sp. UME77]|uniref:esterase/lipase family protein n=1 Tax=Cupriavidus sp. UME77 TaxID=1862321 RepID=UPI001601CB77|nr:hypothetical protein [Cupriavidus sp. UME77]MBB1634272.1 hypothetical protein [Cupriavidus sp. UME77]